MRIVCEKGFYKFFPQDVVEVARFERKLGAKLVECEDYFTFTKLAALPNFSFIGQLYSAPLLGLVNYAGKREEVMAKNGYMYSVLTNQIVLKITFVKRMNYEVNNYIFLNTLPQAYNFDEYGIISGFHGFVDVDIMKFKIERFFYENI